MNKRRLPIGIQTFRKIREEDYYYVDKTAYIRRLLAEGTHYFLSRPRRFGKSLFLDTLKEVFEGNEPLFAGLDIHDRWDWSVRHPVLRLDFSSGTYQGPDDLRKEVAAQLNTLEAEAEIVPRDDEAPVRFRHLMKVLHERSGQRVAVLVDEYDKPILDALEVPEVARANRDFLRGLYSTVKFADAHIRFTFITGVSKFSKVSLFSGLNNLTDITLEPEYSALCGYTDADLDAVFAPELPGLDRDQIRDWYNGYSWLGDEKVYNPFDILLLFRRRRFAAYWFETGTPTFLIETLFKRRVSSLALDEMVGSDELLSTFDVDDIATRGTAVPDRLPDDNRRGRRWRRARLSLGLSQPGGAAEPEPQPAALLGAGFNAADGQQRATLSAAGSQRLRRARDAVPRFLRQHPLRVVHQQRHRPLRGLLRQRVLLLFRGAGAEHRGRGQQQPRALGHGGSVQRQRLSVRVQGGRDGVCGCGDGAVAGAAPTRTSTAPWASRFT